MKYLRGLFLIASLLAGCGAISSANDPADDGWFPPSHMLFKPLLADPRELQYALRLVMPVGYRNKGEVAIGDYFGIYRVKLPGEDNYFQVSGGGGVFARFDLSSYTNELQVADYYANLPFDWRFSKWSFRFMAYHTSSHLGDDYLDQTNGNTTKHTWDNLRWLASYDWSPRLRTYAGYNYVFRTLPKDGRNALQAGTELYSDWWDKGHCQAFWASDFQSWERVEWNPIFTSQAGVTFAKTPHDPRGIALFVEYMAGHRPHGQFYENTEYRWNLGVRFHLS